jgi:hypothetical protein
LALKDKTRWRIPYFPKSGRELCNREQAIRGRASRHRRVEVEKRIGEIDWPEIIILLIGRVGASCAQPAENFEQISIKTQSGKVMEFVRSAGIKAKCVIYFIK